ncbi:MAG: B12-binding domain-containing radical SAM protein [Bacteroidales bacterium]|nr:B12-binding domain-containing radical SAM protein [Bacteroidales bacterium]
MNILLINPGSSDDVDSRITQEISYLFAKNLFAPHAVTAVAALTPSCWHVEVHDEYTRGPSDSLIRNNPYDIVGITITSNQLRRSLYLANLVKVNQPAALVVVGGIGVEHLVSKNPQDVDVVFHGEAEETWPRFLEDYQKGAYLPVYKNVTKPDMTRTPAPRWDLLRGGLAAYTATLVQTTRGCPFDCSFCDVIYTYGRKPRSKTIEQVLDEVKKLHQLNTKMIFIADDNFAGDKKYTKTLLRKLIPLNNSFKIPIDFTTQIDITIAGDEELLQLLADCNFQSVMIGIESENEESLKDYNKHQNIRFPVGEAVRKIQSYGIIVLAHMIVGADSDDKNVFRNTARFITDANIVHHLCHPLAAPYGTKMWYDLKRKGRIISTESEEIKDKLDIVTNIIPKQLSRIELFEGLADYWEEIYQPRLFKQRAIAFIEGIKYKPKIKEPGISALWTLRKMLYGVFVFYMFRLGKEHRKAFFSVLHATVRKGIYLMPKIIYLYTSYLVDYKRSMHDAGVARAHAQWERENPEKIQIDNTIVPVSDKFREHANLIITAAYNRVRTRIPDKKRLFLTVVPAMVDYHDRFGADFETFDQFQLEQINNFCDRIMDQLPKNHKDCSEELGIEPPVGFTREILDALDNAVRYRNMNN